MILRFPEYNSGTVWPRTRLQGKSLLGVSCGSRRTRGMWPGVSSSPDIQQLITFMQTPRALWNLIMYSPGACSDPDRRVNKQNSVVCHFLPSFPPAVYFVFTPDVEGHAHASISGGVTLLLNLISGYYSPLVIRFQ